MTRGKKTMMARGQLPLIRNKGLLSISFRNQIEPGNAIICCFAVDKTELSFRYNINQRTAFCFI